MATVEDASGGHPYEGTGARTDVNKIPVQGSDTVPPVVTRSQEAGQERIDNLTGAGTATGYSGLQKARREGWRDRIKSLVSFGRNREQSGNG